MPMIHGVQADMPQPSLIAEETSHERVLAIKARARRRWFIRYALTLMITASLLCLFMIWRRDHLTVDNSLRLLDVPVKVLQEQWIDKWGLLPSRLSELEKASYASDAQRIYAQQADEPVIIAYTLLVNRLLREDGTCAIFYDKGKVYSKWMTISEFRKFYRVQEKKIKAFEEEKQSRPPQLP